MYFLFLLAVIGGGFVVSLFLSFFKKSRTFSSFGMMVAALMLVFLIPYVRAADQVRMLGFRVVAERAEPLIKAIESYIAENDLPPTSIDDLVPQYISELPYGVPPLQIKRRRDGEWSLSADVSTGMLNWDVFYYESNQDYSKLGAVRLGSWAYYWE